MRGLKLGVVAILLAIALAVAAQNTAVVPVRLLLWQTEMSVFLLIAITLGAGFVMGLAAGLLLRVSRATRSG